MKKYEVGTENDTHKFNLWFNHCQIKQMPYVIIRKRIKYCFVEWDHINLDPVFDHLIAQHHEALRSKLLNLYKKYSNKGSDLTMSNLTFFASNIAIEKSEAFATELFDLVEEVLGEIRYGHR